MRTALDHRAALSSLAARSVPGVERVDVDAGTVSRLVELGAGPVHVTAHVAATGVRVDADGPAAPAALDDLATRWFGLADDLAPVHAALGGDPVLGPLVAARPHLRVPGHPDGFEAAVQVVLTQQVSLGAGRTTGARLASAYGRPGPGGLLAYPRPEDLAAADSVALQAVLRVPHARARAVHALAVACAGGLRLVPGAPAADVRAALLAIPGIGPWTADVVALRALGDRDAFPAGDLVLRRALGVPDVRDVATAGRAWSPWRAFAATHLWAAVGYPAAATAPPDGRAQRTRPGGPGIGPSAIR
ncbi:AlkA domain protein [Cellulomonas flavigena DSM 20109]|uniref:DNA-3-methyladenine glycosylase II n=1 Tax=Cellulomonas flavigena (strain ATCC 482 / DSM 20109 / BCRC 11376 / JCM 18109 / NBRC 3775 / NCIMB 8073 / NRS 134) TaxID=446466 RepID=D5UHI8_CELFN|nr:AlkA N-terminal domain-containing protein [Cellulomonas flavigena]ADG75309.1 AlkA domain protein [Cellulomonas flavigena DSM 20109]